MYVPNLIYQNLVVSRFGSFCLHECRHRNYAKLNSNYYFHHKMSHTRYKVVVIIYRVTKSLGISSVFRRLMVRACSGLVDRTTHDFRKCAPHRDSNKT